MSDSLERPAQFWRDGRVAEGARLESVYTLTGIVGSNPTFSAIFYKVMIKTLITLIFASTLLLAAQTPEQPPAVNPTEAASLLKLERDQVINVNNLDRVVQKYRSMMEQDKEYQAGVKKNDELQQQISNEVNALQAKVDSKKWKFDAASVSYVKVEEKK
jgi:hypothetical protein